jgi:hypothetical protein
MGQPALQAWPTVMARPHHLLIYHFGPSANFEGHLVGAFERMDATGGLS